MRRKDSNMVLGLLLIAVAIALLFPNVFRREMITPPTKVTWEVSGTPQYVDNNYAKVNTKWVFTVTTDTMMTTAGYVWDIDRLINETGAKLNGQPLVARKNVEITIRPKDLTMQVLLQDYKGVTVAEAKSGMNARVRGTSTDDIPVSTNPLKIDYYYSPPERGEQFTQPFDVILTIEGRTTEIKNFEIYTQQTVDLADGKVLVTKAGNLVSDRNFPDLKDFLYIPIPADAPSIPGETRDKSGNRWLILRDGNTVMSRLINKDSTSSYNYYLYGDDRYGKWEYSNTNIYPSQPNRLVNLLNNVMVDSKLSPGTGVLVSEFWHNIGFGVATVWAYPRQADLYSETKGTELTIYDNDAWVQEAYNSELLGVWYVWRHEHKIEGFFPWLVSQTSVFNPTNLNPVPKDWNISSGSVNIVYPASMRPGVITFVVDGSLADVMLYSPRASKFQIVSVEKSADVVRGGQAVTISVTVKNIGEIEGTATIIATSNVVKLDMASASVTLKPGESKVVKFGAYYGEVDKVLDKVTFKVYDTMGNLWDTKSIDLQCDAPIGGLFLGAPSLEPPELFYGKTSKLKVPVVNKQSVTYKGLIVRVTPSGGFTCNPSDVTIDVGPSGAVAEFQAGVTSQTPGLLGTFTIQLIKEGEVIDTRVLNVIANETPTPPPIHKEWWEILLESLGGLMYAMATLIIVAVTAYVLLSWYRKREKSGKRK